MTKTLIHALEEKKYPFTEDIIIVNKIEKNDFYPIFLMLLGEFKKSNTKILINHDWMEHDGYENDEIEYEYDEVIIKYTSIIELELDSPGDFRVKLLFHNKENSIFFRIYFIKEDFDNCEDINIMYFDIITNNSIRMNIINKLDKLKIEYSINNSYTYLINKISRK